MPRSEWARDVFSDAGFMKMVFPSSVDAVPVPGRSAAPVPGRSALIPITAPSLSAAMLRRTCTAVRAQFLPARVTCQAAVLDAAPDGDDEALKLMITEVQDLRSNARFRFAQTAAENGRVDCLRILRARFGPDAFDVKRVCRAAKQAGHRHVEEHFSAREAARVGNTDALQWMLDAGGFRVRYAMDQSKDIATFEWFVDRGFKASEHDLDVLFHQFIRTRDLHTLRYLHAAGAEISHRQLREAAYVGNLEVLQFGFSEFYNAVYNAEFLLGMTSFCYIAIRRNDPAMLRFFLSVGRPMDEFDVGQALRTGGEELVSVVVAHDPPCSAEVFRSAVEGGNMKAIEWASARGWFTAEGTLTAAARGGNLATMKALHAMGCRWDDSTLSAANQSGNAEAVQWLVEMGCPFGSD
jgi:hypothetical protein